MLKWLARIMLGIAVLLIAAFFIFRTPDTDRVAMRAKYGADPSQYIAIDGQLTVHLRDEGPRDAPAIILLHGSNADLHTWQPWVDALKPDYRVIRYDQIGHGLTGPAPDGNYAIEAFVEDVDRVAETLGIERFVLGGNSMGGGIAMAYALEHPEKLIGLVLVDASGAPVKREQSGGNIGFAIAQMPLVNNLVTQITPRSIIERSLDQSVSNKAVVTPQAVDRYWELLRYPGNRAATLARFGQSREPFVAETVRDMYVPTLIMWGEEDALIPFAAAAWFAEHIPETTSVSYPAIGHLPMEEAPSRSAQNLRDWLANLELRTQPS